jgi:hypothetical protein
MRERIGRGFEIVGRCASGQAGGGQRDPAGVVDREVAVGADGLAVAEAVARDADRVGGRDGG